VKWRIPVNPERWQRLKEIFDAALDKDASERIAFLDNACRSDPELRKEAEALLKSHSDSFLEKPAYEAVPELFESEAGTANIGLQFGAYVITGKIGHGGMGIVYLARDTKLDRPVALKMLAPKYTRDPHQRERLKREARAAARLSHPGIATIYALEEFGDDLCMVSEYVPGATLHQILSGRPFPFAQVLDIAIQIAEALAAAHEQGIVHRDLKPENVIRTDSGNVKILDFGLARVEPQDGAGSDMRLTRTGAFLGTPAYASPEQLLGSQVDRNTDIFSFGIMLYEMAAGRHPFGASDSMSTIARILEADAAELSQTNPAIPKNFSHIVRKCLKKIPTDRYGNTRDLLEELRQVSNAQNPQPVAPTQTPFWWWQFHQAVAGFGYYGMLYPLWWVREDMAHTLSRGTEGSLLFFLALIAVGVAANLRLHSWFTSRFYISELSEQRRKASRWIRCADWLFVLVLSVTAVRIYEIHAIIATLLMSVAIGSLVAFSLIEPTTATAALDRHERR
jgi:tRNA A-37 threonylcarbamoyl transferase component Bud32